MYSGRILRNAIGTILQTPWLPLSGPCPALLATAIVVSMSKRAEGLNEKGDSRESLSRRIFSSWYPIEEGLVGGGRTFPANPYGYQWLPKGEPHRPTRENRSSFLTFAEAFCNHFPSSGAAFFTGTSESEDYHSNLRCTRLTRPSTNRGYKKDPSSSANQRI